MRGIILWYSKNRKLIWRIIGISAIVIIAVQLLEGLSHRNQKNKVNNIIASENKIESSYNSITLDETKSTVTGDSMSKVQIDSIEVIDKFIEYCNNNQINEAYDLLSEDCKNEMYPTVDQFKKLYYDSIFTGEKKNISVENWVNNIYKVKIIEDPLSTGVYNTEETLQDYVTIVKDTDDNNKLNINKFIKKQDINKQKEDKEVEIKVLEKNQYMDFETYVFEIINNSNNTVLLNDSNNTDAMYIEDENNIKYSAYIHELSDADLKLYSGETKKITIKYYNKYSSSKKIKNIVFSKIILNYNIYTSYANIGQYNDYGIIQISL